jgi:hypothetical protein
MTTAREIITDAIIDLGQHDPEETPQLYELNRGLRLLNAMIDEFVGDNLLIPYTTSENFACTGATSYTMGSGGTASSTRAETLKDSCYVKDSNNLSYPVRVIDQRTYNNIMNKTLIGRPGVLFYDPIYPIGILYPYKVPDSGYTMYIESVKSLNGDLSLDTALTLPARYTNFLIISLRNRLAGSYGVQVTQIMLLDIDKAERRIKKINSANRLEPMDMPAGCCGTSRVYDINSGE